MSTHRAPAQRTAAHPEEWASLLSGAQVSRTPSFVSPRSEDAAGLPQGWGFLGDTAANVYGAAGRDREVTQRMAWFSTSCITLVGMSDKLDSLAGCRYSVHATGALPSRRRGGALDDPCRARQPFVREA